MATAGDRMADDGPEVERIRATERERLRALVTGDMETANQLHADDFQLINPSGSAFSKEEYLGSLATGFIRYVAWEPDAIAVRLHGDVACLRYQALLEIIVRGEHAPPRRMWHTDIYEQRDGRWQVVWSQATAIQE